MKRALIALALGGCNSILGVGDFRTGDGGVGDDVVDAAIDADPAVAPDAELGTVTGTSIISYVKYDGSVVPTPEDLSGYTIKAYVPDGAGHFAVIDGVGLDDGTFAIPGVPTGTTYYLYLLYPEIPNHPAPVPRLYVTDDRTIDLGFHQIGRPDAVPATLATLVTLNLTNMTPWASGDWLLVDSYNNGSEFSDVPSVTNLPTVGATSTSGYTFDWRGGATFHPVGTLPALLDQTAGDDLVVTHLRTDELLLGTQPYYIERAVGVYVRDDLTQTDGGSLTVAGAFTPITFDQSQTVTVQNATFRNQYDLEGRATAETLSIYRHDNVGAQYVQYIGTGPWNVKFGYGSALLHRMGFAFTIPPIAFGESSLLPTTWGRMLIAYYNHSRRIAAPDALSVTITEGSGSYRPATTALTLVPPHRPIATLSVAGVAALTQPAAIAFDGSTGVTVAWDEIPLVDRYEVLVERVYADANRTKREAIVQLETEGTSVIVPAPLLAQGTRYIVRVKAVTGVDAVGLRRWLAPTASSMRISSVLLFSAACGDGVTQTDLGEQCDTAGESGGCDADCSLVVCRDVYTNVTAGEVCDHGAASLGCDADCTASACGDGTQNTSTEDCDDGNTTDDGNGCGVDCLRVGSCGDGVVQDLFEECEPPNTATCNISCLSQ